jgi:hypothetical protein
MHPVVAKLSEEHRRELFACLDFAVLSTDRRVQLLDEVIRVRRSLASDDHSDAFSDQKQRVADAAKLTKALTAALAILSPPHQMVAGRVLSPRQIMSDMIDGLADYHRGNNNNNIGEAIGEYRAAEETMRRWLAIAQTVEAEPRERMSRKGREARLLRWALADHGVRVIMTTIPVAHATLVLLGLLADPPASADAMVRRLHR